MVMNRKTDRNRVVLRSKLVMNVKLTVLQQKPS